MKDYEVLMLTFPLGNGLLERSRKYGYIHSSGITAMEELLEKNRQAEIFLENIPSEKAVSLDNLSFAQALRKISEQTDKNIYCFPHKIFYFPQAGELARMGFIAEECYEQKIQLKESICFLHKIPLYLKNIMFSPERYGALAVMTKKDADRLKPRCVKVIGYLEDKSSEHCVTSI